MLTDRGWAVLGASVALGLLWVGFGEDELLAGAILLGAATLLALVYVRAVKPRAAVTRKLLPSLVNEGEFAIVEAVVENTSRLPLINATLEDEVVGLGSARFSIGRIRVGEQVTAGYRILCRPRGVYEVGPARMEVRDPLELASAGGRTGTYDRLVVYPHVEQLESFPIVRGRDPTLQAARPEFSHRGGEDFFTIREYQFGDDLRRVHWPTSAKRDEIMIRQLETPWQSRALVLFDIRAERYESEVTFEKAVRGAASVTSHLFQSRFEADVLIGSQLIKGSDPNPYGRAMELLAGVDRQRNLDVRAVAMRLQRTGRGGALIVLTGVPDEELLAAQQVLSKDFLSTIVMTVTETESTNTLQFQRSGAITIDIRPEESWTAAWLTALSTTWSTASAG